MRHMVALALSLCISHLVVAQDLVITNGQLLDGAGNRTERGSVVVADGRIASVSDGSSDPDPGVVVLDAKGMTVMPGMINTHWHVLTGPHAGSDEEIERFIDNVVTELLESLLDRGMTTIMSPGDPFPHIIELRRRLAYGDIRGPRLLVTGPVFTAPDDWPTPICEGDSACKANLTAEMTEPREARKKVRELAEAGVDAVKVVYNDIDDDVVAAIAGEARAANLTFYAHVHPVGLAINVVRLGVRGLVHAPQGIDDRAQILANLEVPVSTTVGPRTRAFVEAMGQEYTDEDEALLQARLESIRWLWNHGVTIAFGTDSSARLLRRGSAAELLFLAEARALNRVLTNSEVITALTRNAAIYLGLENELGTLEPGKKADIVLIDGDPLIEIADLLNVEVVIQDGRIVSDKR